LTRCLRLTWFVTWVVAAWSVIHLRLSGTDPAAPEAARGHVAGGVVRLVGEQPAALTTKRFQVRQVLNAGERRVVFTRADDLVTPRIRRGDARRRHRQRGPDADHRQPADLRGRPPAAGPAACWLNTQTFQVGQMRLVSNGLVGSITAQANSLETSALHNAVNRLRRDAAPADPRPAHHDLRGAVLIRPLRKLRADALEVAGSKLPAMVRKLSESEGGDASAEIEPIGVTSTDEIGEVARAFDQVHREAVRLAADEAMLRGNLNAMFVNLSRRSQSLIERQLSLIDNLEQTEQDSDRLSSLFRLDHWRLACAATRRTSWSSRATRPRAVVEPARSARRRAARRDLGNRAVRARRAQRAAGIQVTGQAVNDVVTWWRRSWRTRPRSLRRTPRCT